MCRASLPGHPVPLHSAFLIAGSRCYDLRQVPTAMKNLFHFDSFASALPLLFPLVLLVILVVSFRSRAKVFCQYLEAMTGITLKPAEVRQVFRESGRDGVRTMFLDLLIREDLKQGPIDIPEESDAPEVLTPPEPTISSGV
jgi:hypothetical protein